MVCDIPLISLSTDGEKKTTNELESAQGWIAQPAATGGGVWVGGGQKGQKPQTDIRTDRQTTRQTEAGQTDTPKTIQHPLLWAVIQTSIFHFSLSVENGINGTYMDH